MNLYSNDLLESKTGFAIESLKYHGSINMNDNHYHSHYEILYIQSGKRTLKINNTLEYTLDSQVIALLKPNVLHQTMSAEDVSQTRVLINISQELMSEITDAVSPSLLVCFNTPVLKLQFYEIKMMNYLLTELKDAKKESPFYKELVKINLSKILLLLSEAYLNQTDLKDDIYASQTANSRVDYIIKYLHENFNSDISMKKIADKLYCTETYISRIFKRATGITPYKYLLNIRIVNACRLLRSGSISKSDIAEECGFTSLVSFSRVFKQIQGCSPTEYQKKYKAE